MGEKQVIGRLLSRTERLNLAQQLEAKTQIPVTQLIHIAMSDALLFSANQLMPAESHWPPSTDGIDSIRAEFKRSTHQQCLTGSLRTIFTLYQNNPDRFTEMFTIESQIVDEDPSTDLNKKWMGRHSYFVVHSDDDLWSAGSPANYDPTDENIQNLLLTDNSLEGLVNQIQAVDGGFWPELRHLNNAFAVYKPYPSLAKIDGQNFFEVMHASRQYMNFTATRASWPIYNVATHEEVRNL